MISFKLRRTIISLLQGDIVDQDTEAIVNAANSSLMGGGGVDGAIHRAGGPVILQQCLEIRKKVWPNGLPPGEAVITTGGGLRAKYVIHTVGPVWNGGKSGEDEKLGSCHENSLRLASIKDIKSISFPAISTGAYGYPVQLASRVALNSIRWNLENGLEFEEIRFVLFTGSDCRTYVEVAKSIFD